VSGAPPVWEAEVRGRQVHVFRDGREETETHRLKLTRKGRIAVFHAGQWLIFEHPGRKPSRLPPQRARHWWGWLKDPQPPG
jgi:hypothetical protein